jgi:thioester reductase-like protein
MPLRSVLLTGASGFLGIFLLAELTRRVEVVHCLELAADEAQGREAIRRQARAARLEIELGRVRVLRGDLAKPALRLPADKRSRLAGDVDAILHCGAFVHHLHSYHTMKAANVDGTAELPRLALEGTRKPFCYVSTLSVATWLSGEDVAHESIVTGTPRVDNGYVLTKWVSEHLVARCSARYGLPAVIARPGNITGASDTGYSNYADNHFWLFVRGCLQLGAFPDMPPRVEMMPVDVVARAIVALALAPRERLLVANLCNPRQLSERDFFAQLAHNGCAVGVSCFILLYRTHKTVSPSVCMRWW